MQDNSCVIFFERKIQGSALAGSYISLEEVILNKSLTRRKANITAVRQSHSSLDEYHKSVRIYLVAESLVGTRLTVYFIFKNTNICLLFNVFYAILIKKYLRGTNYVG